MNFSEIGVLSVSLFGTLATVLGIGLLRLRPKRESGKNVSIRMNISDAHGERTIELHADHIDARGLEKLERMLMDSLTREDESGEAENNIKDVGGGSDLK